jgi:hypothetical protein
MALVSFEEFDWTAAVVVAAAAAAAFGVLCDVEDGDEELVEELEDESLELDEV